MEAAIIIMVVGIILIVSSIIEWNQTNKRIKELENRLEQYYKEREYKLKSIKEFYEIGCGREGCKDTTPHIH
jgi:cell division protein FtsL